MKISLSERERDNQSWADLIVEEEWKDKHESVRKERKDEKVEKVLVASCSDDGTIRIWLPLQVTVYYLSTLNRNLILNRKATCVEDEASGLL